MSSELVRESDLEKSGLVRVARSVAQTATGLTMFAVPLVATGALGYAAHSIDPNFTGHTEAKALKLAAVLGFLGGEATALNYVGRAVNGVGNGINNLCRGIENRRLNGSMEISEVLMDSYTGKEMKALERGVKTRFRNPNHTQGFNHGYLVGLKEGVACVEAEGNEIIAYNPEIERLGNLVEDCSEQTLRRASLKEGDLTALGGIEIFNAYAGRGFNRLCMYVADESTGGLGETKEGYDFIGDGPGLKVDGDKLVIDYEGKVERTPRNLEHQPSTYAGPKDFVTSLRFAKAYRLDQEERKLVFSV